MGAPVTLVMRRWRTGMGLLQYHSLLLLCCLLQMSQTAPPDYSLEDTTSKELPISPHFTVSYTTGSRSGVPSPGASTFRAQQAFIKPESAEQPDLSREVFRHGQQTFSSNAQHFPAPIFAQTSGGSQSTVSQVNAVPNHFKNIQASRSNQNVEFSIGSSVLPSVGASSGTQGGFSSQYIVFNDDDNDSVEDDDYTTRYVSLGRRYHPDGSVPTSPKELFIPPTAPVPAARTSFNSKQILSGFKNPYIYAVGYSNEDLDGDDLDDDDDLKLYVGKNFVSLRRQDSDEERIVLHDSVLKDRYNFVDNQGSIRWGYTLDDQYQNQVVKTDGTMEGKFGWTAPNGREIKIDYIADEGGYRILPSSRGIFPDDDESVKKLKEEHFQIHQGIVSGGAPSGIGSFGVPLPGVQQPGLQVSPEVQTGPVGVPLPAFAAGSGGQVAGSDMTAAPGSFFTIDDDDDFLTPAGGGVPLPGFVQNGQGAADTSFQGPPSGVSLSGPPATGIGSTSIGVPLPSLGTTVHQPVGPPTSGFFEKDQQAFVLDGGGTSSAVATASPGIGEVGVPLPGFGGAGPPGFDTGAATPGFDTGAATPGFGSGTGSTAFGGEVGVPLPGFGVATSSTGSGTESQGLGTGLGSTGFGSADTGFGTETGIANGSPGLDSGAGGSGFGSEFGTLPSASIGDAGTLAFDFGDTGASFGSTAGTMNSQLDGEVALTGGSAINQGIGESKASESGFNGGSTGLPLPGFGGGFGSDTGSSASATVSTTGMLDASDVPLQGPPFPIDFSIDSNFGSGGPPSIQNSVSTDTTISSSAPPTTGQQKGQKIYINPDISAFPFFELGPPELSLEAAGGRKTPFDSSTNTITHLSKDEDISVSSKNDITTDETLLLNPRHQTEDYRLIEPEHKMRDSISVEPGLKTQDTEPQNVEQIYYDIYGLKWQKKDSGPPEKLSAPKNLELPKL